MDKLPTDIQVGDYINLPASEPVPGPRGGVSSRPMTYRRVVSVRVGYPTPSKTWVMLAGGGTMILNNAAEYETKSLRQKRPPSRPGEREIYDQEFFSGFPNVTRAAVDVLKQYGYKEGRGGTGYFYLSSNGKMLQISEVYESVWREAMAAADRVEPKSSRQKAVTREHVEAYLPRKDQWRLPRAQLVEQMLARAYQGQVFNRQLKERYLLEKDEFARVATNLLEERGIGKRLLEQEHTKALIALGLVDGWHVKRLVSKSNESVLLELADLGKTIARMANPSYHSYEYRDRALYYQRILEPLREAYRRIRSGAAPKPVLMALKQTIKTGIESNHLSQIIQMAEADE